MGMVVRTNTMAMNANRSLGINNTKVSKSLEKLSSGYAINRAADDAAGLAISEKMKSQITGLEQASTNAQDGISLIQTAEGATQEIHNMLNRMKELAIKSANGTIQNEVDREAIELEVDALKDEIDRICESTTFNGIPLLNGSLTNGLSDTDSNTNTTPTDFSFDIDVSNSVSGIILTPDYTSITKSELEAGDYTLSLGGKSLTMTFSESEISSLTSDSDAQILVTEKLSAALASAGAGTISTSGSSISIKDSTLTGLTSGTPVSVTATGVADSVPAEDDVAGFAPTLTVKHIQDGDGANPEKFTIDVSGFNFSSSSSTPVAGNYTINVSGQTRVISISDSDLVEWQEAEDANAYFATKISEAFDGLGMGGASEETYSVTASGSTVTFEGSGVEYGSPYTGTVYGDDLNFSSSSLSASVSGTPSTEDNNKNGLVLQIGDTAEGFN